MIRKNSVTDGSLMALVIIQKIDNKKMTFIYSKQQ